MKKNINFKELFAKIKEKVNGKLKPSPKKEKSSGKKELTLSPTVLNYIFLVLSATIVIVSWIYVITPKIKEVNDNKQNLVSMQGRYNSDVQTLNTKVDIQKKLSSWKEYQTKFNSLLQNNNTSITPEQGLYIIEKYARDNYIQVDDLQYVKNADTSSNTVSYTAQFTGEYNSLKMFIYDMEQLVQAATFTNVEMNYKSGNISTKMSISFTNK